MDCSGHIKTSLEGGMISFLLLICLQNKIKDRKIEICSVRNYPNRPLSWRQLSSVARNVCVCVCISVNINFNIKSMVTQMHPDPFCASHAHANIKRKHNHLLPWNLFLTFDANTHADVTCKHDSRFWELNFIWGMKLSSNFRQHHWENSLAQNHSVFHCVRRSTCTE